jgi:ABC-type oligopeptide transport system, periplasmic component
MRKKIMALLLAGSMCALMLTGCNTYTDNKTSSDVTPAADSSSTDKGVTGTPETKTSDTVKIAGGVAITMNEFTSQASNDYDIFYLTMSSLVRYYDGKVEMDAAESYDVSEDGLTYTFHLRKGLTYSDGTAITSKDFEYAFQKFISKDSASAETSAYFGVVGAQEYNSGKGKWDAVGFKCPDENTVVFTLKKADGAFLNNIAINAFFPITKEFAEKWGDSLGSSPESVLCSGPYTLTEWTVDKSMSLVKNDKWWNSANEFPTKNVNILQIDSANTKVSMFENGEVDVISTLDANYSSTISDKVKTYVGSTEMLLWMNEAGNTGETGKLMSNENFRKALTYALDRDAICGAVSAGFVGTNRAVSSNYPGKSDTYVNEYPIDACPVAGDAAKAKEYLNAAMKELGYSDVSKLPKITYVTFERDDMKLLGETLVDSWKQVLGIDNISFTQYPIATAIQNFYTGKYDVFMISVGCTISPTDIIKGFAPEGDYGFFSANWKTNISDKLAAADACEFQSDEYFKKVAELETAFLNEYAIVPLYNQTFYYALADGVDGFVTPGVAYNYQINHLTVSK